MILFFLHMVSISFRSSSTFCCSLFNTLCLVSVDLSLQDPLQKLLKLKADGLFGEATENALLKAQEAHGLTVDGICGPASWKALSGADKYL